jgi:hypothetical protein
LGRLTGEDIAQRKRQRQRVHGYLSFAGDAVPERLKPLHLGNVTDLELCLRMLHINEVYIAGNSLLQGDAIQAATKVCETFGIPFALPAYSVRLDRAQPVDNRTVSDGYLHFTSVKSQPNARVLKRVLDVLAAASALWILAPLLTGGDSAGEAHLARAGLLPPAARGPARSPLPHPEVPLDGAGRRDAAEGARGPERAERARLQDAQ